MNRSLSIAFVSLLVATLSATAQRVEQITENPDAVQLRELWRVQGGAEDRVGYGVGGLGDLNEDGADEWCIYYGSLGEWQAYHGNSTGDLPSEPSWRFSGSPSLSHPVIGDFYGNGEKLIGFNRDVRVEFHWELQVHFFGIESGTLSETATVIYDPHLGGIKDVQAADLDGDGADEMIVARAYGDTTEILIYAGGQDFQVETPTHVIVDPDSINNNYFMTIRDVDGDQRLDLLTGGDYRTAQRYKIKMNFGSATSPWSWNGFERKLERPEGSIGPDWVRLSVYDVNGDGVSDFHGNVYIGPEEKRGGYLWLSGTGWDARTRPYDSTDWDVHYLNGYIFDQELGPLNDATGRWNALNMGPDGDPRLYVFSTGENGPNATWDAIAGDGSQTMFNVGGPVGDVNGDGWTDILFGNFNYRFRRGVAAIFAGGAYIPNDDTTVSVREVPVAGASGGLYVWPNPVIDDLHIAWRGNLKKMPARLAVHDLLGRLVAEGEVDTWKGVAVIPCTGFAPGSYYLQVYDEADDIIATAGVVKQ